MRTLYLKFLYSLVMAITCLATFSLPSKELSLTAHARLLAGMKASDIDSHALKIESSDQWIKAVEGQPAKYFWDLEEFCGKKNQLNKEMLKRSEIESFLATNLSEAYSNTRNVLYLFGGPDFCYPDLFFPSMENIIMVGQEAIGFFPNANQFLKHEILGNVMLEIGKSFAQIPFRSYFITKLMHQEFQEYGIATILAISLVLADYHIVDYQKFFLDKKGMLQTKKIGASPEGIKIIYRKFPDDIERAIYYFCLDLNKEKIFPHFATFVEKIGIDTAFYKATSFMTQSREFFPANQLALNLAKYIVQGESGIPYRSFNPDLWKIKLFGIYARPYHLLQNLPQFWGFQEDLRDIYLVLIWSNGSENIHNIVSMIWDAKICEHALDTEIPPNITWEGITPLIFDYGGDLIEEKLRSYTSAIQYAIKK